MNDIKMVAAFAENKPGQVAHFTKILAGASVNIRWLAATSTGPFGVMKFLVSDPEKACEALKHEGFVVKLVNALAIEVPDKPGGMYAVAECLAGHKINLDNASGFIANNRAILVIEVSNHDLAHEVLKKQGFRVLSQKELPV